MQGRKYRQLFDSCFRGPLQGRNYRNFLTAVSVARCKDDSIACVCVFLMILAPFWEQVGALWRWWAPGGTLLATVGAQVDSRPLFFTLF